MAECSASDTTKSRILLVEDHRDLAEMVVAYLERRGYAADYAADGVTGLHLAVTSVYDVIVLDLSLPGLDGMEFCRRLREDARSPVPMLMLTARDTVGDRIAGLRAGADDYMVKPFDINELEARLQALLRRSRQQVTSTVLRVGDLTLDTGTLEARRDGRVLPLTPTALGLLEALMRASPRVLTRAELEFALWGDEPPDSDALRSHLYMLRRAVDRDAAIPLVHTVKHRGYRVAVLDEAGR
jgi:DNA-binding response OmpR family regulator